MAVVAVNTHQPPAHHLDLAVQGKFRAVRCDFNWLDIEVSPDVFVWDRFDAMVSGARARNLEVFATLAYTPPWLGDRRSVPPVDRWTNFVRQVAERYNHNVWHWGIWNEPNSGGFWQGGVDRYIDTLLLPAAEVLHSINPANRVIGPDLSHNDNWSPWLQEVINEAGSQIDIVSHHIYHENGREVLRRLREVYDIARKPIWLTETGLNTHRYSEKQQASCIDQLLESLPKYEWLQRVFLYQLVDEPSTGLGLLRTDLTPKPAFFVCQRRLGAS